MPSSVNDLSVYAFVSWMATITVYAIFLAWSLIPEKMLVNFGITYYPSKFYALSLPLYFIVTYIFSGIFYMSWNMINTLDPESLQSLKCSHCPKASNNYVKCGLKEGIPDMSDMDPLHISYLIASSSSSSS